MTYGIEKFGEDLGAAVAADFIGTAKAQAGRFASPIEDLFYMAFVSALYSHPRYSSYNLALHQGVAEPKEGAEIYLATQAVVLDWPVDFLIFVSNYEDRTRPCHRLVIECDGHDFHERTKEQAARDRSRDRALLAAGYGVMRFTGSELYRDPMKCIVEVLEWCVARHWGR